MTVLAVSPPGIATGRANPAQKVFSVSNGLQVVRVNAARDSAEMIEFESFGDRPNKKFVGEAVCGDQGDGQGRSVRH